jgi:hypothetical protein
MLLFIKCFGAGVNETVCVLLDSSSTVGELKSVVAHLRPRLSVKRYLYAGKELKEDNRTLYDYRIVKESSIQCACQLLTGGDDAEVDVPSVDSPSIDDELPTQSTREVTVPQTGLLSIDDELPGVAPAFGRTISADVIQFGDAIVVQLVSARRLLPMDWNGLADPYVLLTFDGQTAKSSISKGNLNPVWRETFLFWMPPRPTSSVLAISVRTRTPFCVCQSLSMCCVFV